MNESGDPVGYLRTAFSAESGVGRVVKGRDRVEAFGRFAGAGEVPERASPVFRMARSGSPVRRVSAESEGCDQCLGRAREHLSLLTAVAV